MTNDKSVYLDWADLAFAGKNKEYGGYRLRKRYGRALMIAFLLVVPTFAIVVFALQLGAVSIEPELIMKIDYSKYYGPKLRPPPTASRSIKKPGVRKLVVRKGESPQTPHAVPIAAVAEPTPQIDEIVDPTEHADEHAIDGFVSTAESPSDEHLDSDYERFGGASQGGDTNEDSTPAEDYGVLGNGAGFDLEKLKFFAVMVSDDGNGSVLWIVDSKDSVITHPINYFSNDVQDLFVGKGFTDKGVGGCYVRVNQFQAVNLMWLRKIKDGRVHLFTGHEIDLEPKYEWLLRTQLESFRRKYLYLLAEMRK